VSSSEILECFRDERDLLFRIALLITGNIAAAEQSLVDARELAKNGLVPFHDWLVTWAVRVTTKAAILNSRDAIYGCETAYANARCDHIEHLLQSNVIDRGADAAFLFRIDPGIVIAELDPLARTILVLRILAKSSISNCALQLGVSTSTAVAANCRAMGWLRDATQERRAEHAS
jgi:hypothetical protein